LSAGYTKKVSFGGARDILHPGSISVSPLDRNRLAQNLLIVFMMDLEKEIPRL
jgi:hypothetical protein